MSHCLPSPPPKPAAPTVQIAASSKQTELITGPSLAVGTSCFSRTAVNPYSYLLMSPLIWTTVVQNLRNFLDRPALRISDDVGIKPQRHTGIPVPELLLCDRHGGTSLNEQTGMQVPERFQTATRYAKPIENRPKDSLNYVVGTERRSLPSCEEQPGGVFRQRADIRPQPRGESFRHRNHSDARVGLRSLQLRVPS